MGEIHAREGNVSVKMSGTLADIARRAVEKVLPGVLARLEAEARAVGEQARADWPVRTGVSRAGLEVRTVIDLGRSEVRAEIANEVPYAPFIRPLALYGTTTAWAAYVRVPRVKIQKRLAKELGPTIVAALTRGG
jgi:hypothetical protein